MTQRELADKAGVAQPSVARIESGTVIPRVDTLDRLLRACGETLKAAPQLGIGVDLTLFDALLQMSPEERFEFAVESGRNLQEFLSEVRRTTV